MVYDLIPFFNEIDILKLRLGILDPYVDKFIIEEATTTFSGEPKELCFEKNKDLFRDYLVKTLDQVIFLKVISLVGYLKILVLIHNDVDDLVQVLPEQVLIFLKAQLFWLT